VRVGDHAAEIIGVSDRHIRRWERYEEFGYDGLFESQQAEGHGR